MTQPPSLRRRLRGLLAAALLVSFAGAASGQERPASPEMTAAQAAFEALPEAERRAIQSDLIWGGSFSGAVSGSFGPLTFRAINAAKGGRGPLNGVLTPAERKALAAKADAARRAAGFRIVTDARTGIRIGVPTALLPKTEATASGGSRWQSADGRITLDTSSAPTGDGLAPLFEKATGDNVPGRKITYKLLRPDFFVVTGETQTGRFYRRLAAGPGGLRGFSIGYEKALASTMDRLVIAIASSFEPFPSAEAPAVAGGAAPAPQAPAKPSARYGVGVVVADRTVLTASVVVDNCRGLQVGGRPARVRATDPAAGLALLDVEGGALAGVPGLRDSALPAGGGAVVLAYGETDGRRAALALPAEATAGAIRAPLQPGQAGSPVFDRQGRLAAVVTGESSEKGLVAGVAPIRLHAVADGPALTQWLGRAGITLPSTAAMAELSTGGVVAGAGRAAVPVTCAL